MDKYKMPQREQKSNKGTFGKVLNFSGSKNYIGAAYLSTVAVLKVGGGFVALATEKDIIRSVSTLLPEAVYLSQAEGINNIENFSVVLLGCGLGLNRKSKDLVQKVLKQLKKNQKPLIIDADGLNILSTLNNIVLPQHTILTPHPLEAARLLGISLEAVLNDLESSAKKLVEKYNCTVVLKTHRTIICDRNNIFVNQHGNSALAKAGSGDVLAGIIAGLLAQGVNQGVNLGIKTYCKQAEQVMFEMSKLGVYLHSRAGEIAAEELTEYSVLASELPNYLHIAIKEIL